MKLRAVVRQVVFFMVSALLLAGAAQAATPVEVISGKIKTAFPDDIIVDIKPAALPGYYLVTSANYDPIFVSADGKYMVQGSVMELRGGALVNLYDEQIAQQRKAALASVPADKTIVFPAKGHTKGVAYVFTDVDCPYCRKLHAEVPAMNAMGIEVRYLAFPRTGPDSSAARKMEKVWCAVDRNAALSDAKLGHTNPGAQRNGCKPPVVEQFGLGVSLGIHGTPTVILADGTEVGGYLTAADLAKQMDLK